MNSVITQILLNKIVIISNFTSTFSQKYNLSIKKNNTYYEKTPGTRGKDVKNRLNPIIENNTFD